MKPLPSTAPICHGSELPRARLLAAGLQLFAQHGYAKTSTRVIAAAAQANVAAISYYFGDKAGLYRAVFDAALQPLVPLAMARADSSVTLAEVLPRLFDRFLDPLQRGEAVRQCMKLHRREMLEPTGIWAEQLETGIKPMHASLVRLLARHFGLRRPDDDVHRLAIAITGLAVHLFVGHDVIEALAPQLSATPQALALWRERLMIYANALIAAEGKRRQQANPTGSKTAPKAAPKTARKTAPTQRSRSHP